MKNKNVQEKRQEEENKTAEKAPAYIVNKPDFYCPLAPTMLWHHGLYYSECPLKASERDMSSCNGCRLKGIRNDKANSSQKERNNFKKNNTIVEEKVREQTPVIGKTYSSDSEE
jgi:hypothetical protein